MTRILAALLLGACSGGSDSAPDAGGDGDGDGDLDLSRASWEISPVDGRTDNVSFDPAVAFAGDQPVFAWIDLTPATAAYQLHSAVGPDLAIETRSALLTDATLRLTQLRAAAGGGAHLAVGGGPRDTPEDVFYAGYDGAAWTDLVDVSTAADPDDLEKTEPTAVDLDDAVAVVFLARAGPAEPDGVYAIRFSDPTNPGPLVTVLDRARYDCTDLEARSIAAGGGVASIHVIAACTLDGGPRQLFYANDRSGQFVVQAVDLGGSTAPFDPDFGVDAAGELHVVWVGTVDCDGGTCREVFYSRNLSPPAPITNQGGDGGFRPRIAIDALGRAIVVYHRQETDATLHWTYNEGAGFVRSQLVLPAVAGDRHWLAGGLEIGPDGAPQVVFVHTPGATPSNADVLRGVLVD